MSFTQHFVNCEHGFLFHSFAISVAFNNAGRSQQSFENKKFVDIPQQCFALLPRVNFPAHNLNFH